MGPVPRFQALRLQALRLQALRLQALRLRAHGSSLLPRIFGSEYEETQGMCGKISEYVGKLMKTQEMRRKIKGKCWKILEID